MNWMDKLDELERDACWGKWERLYVSLLLIASFASTVVGYLQGSAFSIFIGVAGLVLFVRSLAIKGAVRAEQRENIRECKEMYASLSLDEQRYVDEYTERWAEVRPRRLKRKRNR